MRSVRTLILDVVLIVLASFAAAALRVDFELSTALVMRWLPYIGVTSAMALIVLPLLGITRTIWRYSTLRDYLAVALAACLIVALAMAITFAHDRLDSVPRSLPIIQLMMMIFLLVGVRAFARIRAARPPQAKQLAGLVEGAARDPILVVGISRLADLYLRAVRELETAGVDVVGILGRAPQHTGRAFSSYPVLGVPEDVTQVIKNLEIHGVWIKRVVVALPMEKLSAEARAGLLEIERGSKIEVEYLTERLGLGQRTQGTVELDTGNAITGTEPLQSAAFQIPDVEREHMRRRRYWATKRFVDVVFAAVLIVLLLPVMLVASILVALDVGFPLAFWQQRPGLGGRPFRLFKFRTMASSHDRSGRRIPDDRRLSSIGKFLRRTRLDELPQLYNVLVGEMSFVGPRPLLPIDQGEVHAARLLIRPGLTGWAQVIGGRTISADDKAALDIWYVKNASFRLDLEILVRTVGVVLMGERVTHHAIERAWRELSGNGAANHEKGACSALAQAGSRA